MLLPLVNYHGWASDGRWETLAPSSAGGGGDGGRRYDGGSGDGDGGGGGDCTAAATAVVFSSVAECPCCSIQDAWCFFLRFW